MLILFVLSNCHTSDLVVVGVSVVVVAVSVVIVGVSVVVVGVSVVVVGVSVVNVDSSAAVVVSSGLVVVSSESSSAVSGTAFDKTQCIKVNKYNDKYSLIFLKLNLILT